MARGDHGAGCCGPPRDRSRPWPGGLGLTLVTFRSAKPKPLLTPPSAPHTPSHPFMPRAVVRPARQPHPRSSVSSLQSLRSFPSTPLKFIHQGPFWGCLTSPLPLGEGGRYRGGKPTLDRGEGISGFCVVAGREADWKSRSGSRGPGRVVRPARKGLRALPKNGARKGSGW